MNLDDTLTQTFQTRLEAVDLPVGDPAAARRTGVRMRVRRRLAVGAVGAAVIAAATGVALGGSRFTSGAAPAGSTGHWRDLPDAPLSPRAGAVGVWTGTEVLFVGGETNPCPPNASCAQLDHGLRDGAAYDPATDTWHAIADAPVPVVSGDRLVAASGTVILRHFLPSGSAWFAYDLEANHWSPITGAPDGVGDLPSALGASVYAIAGGRVVVYSVQRDGWTTLPSDPIEPALEQRAVTATSDGPVVTGVDSTQPNDGRQPSVVLADIWDGTSWRRLPPTGQLGNYFAWTGTRMVDPDPFTEDGGQVDAFPHVYPDGGTLDPATGTWGQLPSALHGDPNGWGVSTNGGGWFAVAGQVYNDHTGQVSTLPRPDGAPDMYTSAAWAGDTLVAFGGVDSSRGYGADALTNRAWIYTP